MNCTSCGATVPQGSALCTVCGRPVTAPGVGWSGSPGRPGQPTQPIPVRPDDTRPIGFGQQSPPPYGQAQPPYGQAQPPYGQQPPAYGQQPPPAYGRPGPTPPTGPNYFPPVPPGGGGRPPYGGPPGSPSPRGPRAGVIVAIVAAFLLVVGGGATAAVLATRDDPDVVADDDKDQDKNPDQPLSDQELAETWGPSVFRVEASGCDATSSGTAFVIDDRHLVTNRHVVSIDDTPTVHSRDGGSLEGRVVGWSSSPDIAVIEVEGDLPEPLDWASTDDLTEGQHLVALGYPVPDLAFSVTPSSIVSFQSEGEARQAIRADGALDRGNSGGPALTETGQVAGVVTEMADNADGFQLVPLLFTAEALTDTVDGFISEPTQVDPDCGSEVNEIPEDWEVVEDAEPQESTEGQAWAYGDDPALDALQDACTGGDMGACDDLYWQSALGSDYESFGATCGQRIDPEPGGCVSAIETGTVDDFGSDGALDVLWLACAAGDDASCHELWAQSPSGSAYEDFAGTCGGRTSDQGSSCDSASGDSFAALYAACAAGDLVACDDLYWATPVGSPEEEFGSTCGGRSEETSGGCA